MEMQCQCDSRPKMKRPDACAGAKTAGSLALAKIVVAPFRSHWSPFEQAVISIRSPISSERNHGFLVTDPTAGCGMSLVDQCDEYRRFAEACIEMARRQQSPHERAILLQMAYIWSRLAEQAAAVAKDEAG